MSGGATFEFTAPAPPMDSTGYGFYTADGLSYTRNCFAPPPPSPVTMRAAGHHQQYLDPFFSTSQQSSPVQPSQGYKSVVHPQQQHHQQQYPPHYGAPTGQPAASQFSAAALNALSAAPKYPSPPHPLPQPNPSADGVQNYASLYPSGSTQFAPTQYSTASSQAPSGYHLATAPHSPQSQSGYGSVPHALPQSGGRSKRARESDGPSGDSFSRVLESNAQHLGDIASSPISHLPPSTFSDNSTRSSAAMPPALHVPVSDYSTSKSYPSYYPTSTTFPPQSPSTNIYSPNVNASHYMLSLPQGSMLSGPSQTFQFFDYQSSQQPYRTGSSSNLLPPPSSSSNHPIRQTSSRNYIGASSHSALELSTSTNASYHNTYSSQTPLTPVTTTSDNTQFMRLPVDAYAPSNTATQSLSAPGDTYYQPYQVPPPQHQQPHQHQQYAVHTQVYPTTHVEASGESFGNASRPVLPYPSYPAAEKYTSNHNTSATALLSAGVYAHPPTSTYNSHPEPITTQPSMPISTQTMVKRNHEAMAPPTITGTNGSAIELIDLTDTPAPPDHYYPYPPHVPNPSNAITSSASSSSTGLLLPPPPKKRRRIAEDASVPEFVQGPTVTTRQAKQRAMAAAAAMAEGTGYAGWMAQQQAQAYAATAMAAAAAAGHGMKQEPHVGNAPVAPRPLNAPCDDAEGHFIVKVNDDLSPRYKILRLLGQGTFGKVVEAYDRVHRCRVAIKIIRAVQKYRDASRTEIRVLTTLKERDPQNTKRCIHLTTHFDHRNHVCMVFELLAQSVFDFLKENQFNPFPMWQIRAFATQILEAVAFLHGLGVIHTDLKPENLMLESSKSRSVPGNKRHPNKSRKELLNTNIRLIDFGSAIFHTEYHSSVVSTRHYRAPEIILGLGWSFPCDMWSVGCILVEFFTGDALFQTHDNLEHLAMMESVLGKVPDSMIRTCLAEAPKPSSKYFRKNRTLDWPQPETTKNSQRYVRAMPALRDLLRPCDEATKLFADLVGRLLTYDPKERITARQALAHPFFGCHVEGDMKGYMAVM